MLSNLEKRAAMITGLTKHSRGATRPYC